MKIGSQEYALGQVVPDSVVAAAAPLFYAAVESTKGKGKEKYSDKSQKLQYQFSMLGVEMGAYDALASNDYDHEASQKKIKEAAKKGEILVFGGEYLPQKSLKGKFFIAKCTGLAKPRHPEADAAIRIQDATHSYPLYCSDLYTRECK